MAAHHISAKTNDKIIAEWRTGKYSQRDLAERHKVSNGYINKICKGVPQDMSAVVSAGVAYKQGLAATDEQTVFAVVEAVDDAVKYAKFFGDAAIRNVRQAMAAPCNSQHDYKARAETIVRGREVVLGRAPDTIINNANVSQSATIDPGSLSNAALAEIMAAKK